MIYSLHFCLEGIIGPGGTMSEDRGEVVAYALDLARSGVVLLDDWVTDADWFDADGNPSDVNSILDTDEQEDLVNAIAQVSDAMKARQVGFIDIKEHDDLFALLDHHHAWDWLPEALRNRADDLRRAYRVLIGDLSDEWGGV